MRRILLLTAILILLSLNIISAEIMLSQPSTIYNLGDKLEISATIKPSQDTSSLFELNLKCEDESKNFYREPLNLKANEQKQISSSLSLTNSFLQGMNGSCLVSASFSNEIKQTQKFKISDEIKVFLSIENLSVEAGKGLEVKGEAIKENGKNVEGFVEVNIEDKVSVTREITNGSFAVKFSLPENMKSGNYILNVRAYEKAGGEETNYGEAEAVVNIKKIPKKIEIAISRQSINPGDKLTFKPLIYDQANEQVEGDVSVKVYDSYDNLFLQKILKSGEEQEISLEDNASSGYWIIEGRSLGLEVRRLFYVEILERAKFEIVNDTLIITNIGNVVYRKAVQISINDFVEVKNLDLDVGESKSFRLAAPDGTYDITVTDGEESLNVEDVSLTGNVVGVSEIGRSLGIAIRYPLVLLFLIVVFAMFIIMLLQRVSKKKFYAFPVEKKIKGEEKIGKEVAVSGEESKKEVTRIGTEPGKAEHTVVLDGRKENTGIVVVKIKDLNEIKKTCGETLNSITKTIIDDKGMIHETPDFLIGIFASPGTKTFANEIIAVKTAKRIEGILNEHNRKFRQKIGFGISSNSGDLIVKKDSGILKFTSIGGTINLARKIADMANNELLLSDDMYKKVMNEVKVNKETRQGLDVYHIARIVERDSHKSFIQGFLERQKAGK